MSFCLSCQKPIKKGNKYCNRACHYEQEFNFFVCSWLVGEKSGSRDVTGTSISSFVREYLFRKYGGACAYCGWNKINPTTGKCPLETHHINGNCADHAENNLVLLCPNCHSLTASFRALNKNSKRRKRS